MLWRDDHDPGLHPLAGHGKAFCSIEPMTMMAGASLASSVLGGLFGKKGGGEPIMQTNKQENTQVTNLSVNNNIGSLPDLSYSLGSYRASVSGGGLPVSTSFDDYLNRITAPALSEPAVQTPFASLVGYNLSDLQQQRKRSAQAAMGGNPLASFDAAYPWAKYAALAALGIVAIRKLKR